MKDELGRFYKSMTLRHLEFPRSDEALANMEQFVEEVNGADYEFKLSQLVTR